MSKRDTWVSAIEHEAKWLRQGIRGARGACARPANIAMFHADEAGKAARRGEKKVAVNHIANAGYYMSRFFSCKEKQGR